MILVSGSTGKAGTEPVRKLQRLEAPFRVRGGATRVTPDVERVTGHRPISFDQVARDPHGSAWK